MISRDAKVAGLVLAVALAPPVFLWLRATGDPRWYVGDDVPPGQLLYVLAKLGGLVAMTLFIVQLSLMVLRVAGVRAVRGWWSARAHRLLGASVVMAVLLHAGLFTSAASLRSGHIAWHPLMLNWSSGFYDRMVSLGVIALVAMVMLALLGHRVGRGTGRVRALHRLLALLCAPLALAHSFAIGSETGTPIMTLFYLALTLAGVAGGIVLARSGRRGGNRALG